MAARTPVEKLQNEACCSICLEIFQDPVSIHCGHSFCRSCITQSWEGLTSNFSCPQCRKTKSRKIICPNWELANMIEAAKRLNLPPVREVEGGQNFCEEHQKRLTLFCQDDKKLICLVCDKSKVHRYHSVVPMDEAAQQYKVRGVMGVLRHKGPEGPAVGALDGPVQPGFDHLQGWGISSFSGQPALRQFKGGKISHRLLLQLERSRHWPITSRKPQLRNVKEESLHSPPGQGWSWKREGESLPTQPGAGLGHLVLLLLLQGEKPTSPRIYPFLSPPPSFQRVSQWNWTRNGVSLGRLEVRWGGERGSQVRKRQQKQGIWAFLVAWQGELLFHFQGD
uniref:Uncharacterized protein n=1 Tax=Calidris pygmaea TaxID=425635 RepID=A0A8C3JMU9_9CHAR